MKRVCCCLAFAACLLLRADLLKFAFAVYRYKKSTLQVRSRVRRKFSCKTPGLDCVAALVTGVLDTWVDDEQGAGSLVPGSTLELLDDLLGVWAETCGLDFSAEEAQDFPSSICWSKKQDDALPIIHLLIKRGYKPGKG